MEPTDAKTFGMQLDQLGSIFNVDLSAQKKHGYWLALVDQPIEAVLYACIEALKAESVMPVPAVLRAHARQWSLTRGRHRSQTAEELLQIREALYAQEELQKLIANVWPEEGLRKPLEPWEREDDRAHRP